MSDNSTSFHENQFELNVHYYSNNGQIDEDILKQSVKSVSLNLLSGSISFDLLSNKDTFNFTLGLHKNDRLHIKYILYNSDKPTQYTVFDRDVGVLDIIYNSNCYKSDLMTIRVLCIFFDGHTNM